jgi:hypothetical protein
MNKRKLPTFVPSAYHCTAILGKKKGKKYICIGKEEVNSFISS